MWTEFGNRKCGFQNLLNIVKGRRAKAVIESTGSLWIRLYTVLEESGIEVVGEKPVFKEKKKKERYF